MNIWLEVTALQVDRLFYWVAVFMHTHASTLIDEGKAFERSAQQFIPETMGTRCVSHSGLWC
ncbi:MAG: hypothetical protein AB4050_20550 [Synechococcus sp.]